MQDDSAVNLPPVAEDAPAVGGQTPEHVVSTHVLVPEQQVERLRELSKRTRIHQSEYLREAVDDLLAKYGCEEPKAEKTSEQSGRLQEPS
jgi:hypothetical protein